MNESVIVKKMEEAENDSEAVSQQAGVQGVLRECTAGRLSSCRLAGNKLTVEVNGAQSINNDKPSSLSCQTRNSFRKLDDNLLQYCKCCMQDQENVHTENRLSLSEKRKFFLSSAKLRASGKTSALLSGFTMVAMVELEIGNTGSKIPPGLLVVFAASTTILVATHLLAVMISTCILPHMEAARDMDTDAYIIKSPHSTMQWYVEAAWICSTVLGIFLFLVEIALISWIKFYTFTQTASWFTTALLIPIAMLFLAFALQFYQKLIGHNCHLSDCEIKQLENIKKQLEKENLEGLKGNDNPAFCV